MKLELLPRMGRERANHNREIKCFERLQNKTISVDTKFLWLAQANYNYYQHYKPRHGGSNKILDHIRQNESKIAPQVVKKKFLGKLLQDLTNSVIERTQLIQIMTTIKPWK